VQEALAQLAPADRKLAEAQGFCAISNERLGSMGTPIKVLVQGQPVFLCCESCKDRAITGGEKTLARVKERAERKDRLDVNRFRPG
jgi:hypothetical protein